MRTTVQPDPKIQATKHPRQDARPPAPRTHQERRTTSIFVDRRHQSR